jgi:hypothetical protein
MTIPFHGKLCPLPAARFFRPRELFATAVANCGSRGGAAWYLNDISTIGTFSSMIFNVKGIINTHACSCYIRRFGIPCWAIWLICFFFARASSAFTPPNESAKVRCYSWVDMLPLLRPPWFSLRITCGTWDTSDTVFQISAQKQSTKSVHYS